MKLAVIIDNTVYNWQSECISRIAGLKNIDLTIVKLVNTEVACGRGLSRWLYDVYDRFDNKFFSIDPVALHEVDSFPPPFEIAQTVEIDSKAILMDNTKDFLINLGLDLIVNLTPMDLSFKHLYDNTRIGIIELKVGSEKRSVSCPPGFWEVNKMLDAMGLIVYLTKQKGKRVKLYEGSSIVNYKSVSRTNNVFFWKIPGIIAREVDRMSKGSNQINISIEAKSMTTETKDSKLDFPNGLQIFTFLLRMPFRILNRVISGRLNLQQWILLVNINQGKFLGNDFKSFKRIVPPMNRYWADPFVYERNDKIFIFMEEVYSSNNKGIISVMELDRDGKEQKPRIIIEEDFHLSYPFLIENEGTLYMIPESSEKREIRVYKCIEFPFEWEFEKTIMKDLTAVDSTVIFFEGLYWMFTNIASHEATSTYDELYLFYAEDLLSDNWISHPENPIVTDVKNARPAGSLYEMNGVLYRPSQNCSIRYGYGMQINRILELTKNHFREEVVESIYPDWQKDLLATHTINSKGDFTVIDALIKRRKLT